MQGLRELIQLHLAHESERVAAAKQAELRARIAALEADLAGARSALEAAEAEVKRIHLERKTAELDVSKLEDTRRKYRDQLMSAKTNEIYKTLLHEIETTTTAISARETAVLELMETSEAAQARAAEAKDALAAAQARRASQEQRLMADVAQHEEERIAAVALADQAKVAVPPALLSHYLRIREGRDGRGMALVVGHECTACRVAVRPQEWVDMVSRDEIFQCAGCKRILYRRENAEPAAHRDAAPPEAAGSAVP